MRRVQVGVWEEAVGVEEICEYVGEGEGGVGREEEGDWVAAVSRVARSIPFF